MIDHFVIFSKTGTVLWSRTLCKLGGDPVDNLINRVLMEDRAGEKKFIDDAYAMQWVFENKLDLVFVVVYQKILQLLYIEELLEIVKKDFIAMFPQQIASKTPVKYEDKFTKILKATEIKFTEKQARKGPRSFNSSKKAKAKGVASNTSGKTASSSRTATTVDSSEDGSDSPTSDGKDKSLEELENEAALRSKVRKMRTGPRRKGKDKAAKEPKKSGKKMTKWDDTKVSKKEAEALDRSKTITAEEEEAQLREKREAYIGEMEDSDSEEFSDTDDESAASSGAESDSSQGWSFTKTRLGNFLSTVSGNKILEREDLEPVITPMHQMLISKNVASEVADELCESVITTVIGQRLESFTRISTVVRKALEAALLRILTPKKSTDVLREILQAKAEGRAYSIVFVGVNGVGKSTSLSKVCYYLKSKGVNVMIAACDTFRSGAVEQLNQHAKVLDVELFQKGYAKDPASVAKEAIKYGTENGYDCPLMRALAKLVSNNEPDLVLFVGEALVGNDGIDQLSMFDRALADYSDRREPHRIDGIVITKFDTIDDKVGAAVSMVYKTGQPIMFVGTGQKYTHLKKLNVRTVLRHLLQ
ncbi:P-loop containing nucleoside triphosphate hydrolase [Phytophthora cactorum]|nr:P-loop containing nucleoside triphosphate hydrolase [Phytophthora cactorum]